MCVSNTHQKNLLHYSFNNTAQCHKPECLPDKSQGNADSRGGANEAGRWRTRPQQREEQSSRSRAGKRSGAAREKHTERRGTVAGNSGERAEKLATEPRGAGKR